MREAPAYLRFSLNRPVTVLLAVATAVVLGGVALRELSLQMFPSGFSGNSLHVFVPLRSVVPSQLERDFVPEVEDALRDLPDLVLCETHIRSGSCRFHLHFGPEADVNRLVGEVRDRMERVRHLFPEGTDRYFLWHFNPEVDMPVVLFSVSFPPEVEDIWYLLEEVIRPSLEALPSVGQVDLWGYVPRHVAILLDRQRTGSLRVGIGNVIQALAQDNQNFAVGRVRVGGAEVPARVLARFDSLEDYASFPVRPELPLRKISRVSWQRRSEDFRPSYLDGRRNVVVAVRKTSTANTVATCRQVTAHLARRFSTDSRLKDLTYHVFFNQGEEISQSLRKLAYTGLWGALFACFILFLFLRHGTLTLIIVLAIPLSLFIALLFVYFTGGTLNLFSMAGLTIVVGMLVDNAIVVLERVFLLRQEGQAAREAAWRGTSEVALAVVTATATTVAAFLPLIFMARERQARVATRELGTPVCFALAASLGVALLVVPLATVLLARKVKRRDPARTFWITRWYCAFLKWTLRHRFESALCFGVLAGVVPLLMKALPVVKEQDRFHDAPSLRVNFPGGASWKQAAATFQTLLEVFNDTWRNQHDVEHVWHRYDRSGGMMRFFLTKGSRWTRQALEEELAGRAPELPGVEIHTGSARFDREDLTASDVRVAVYGFRSAVVRRVAEDLHAFLKARFPGVHVQKNWREGEPELTVGVRRGFATRRAVAPSQVAGVISWALRGARLRDFSTPEAEIPVWVHWQQVDQDLESLNTVRLAGRGGSAIPLPAFTTLRQRKPSSVIRRENGRAGCVCLLRFPQKEASEAEEVVRKVLSEFPLPPSCTVEVVSGQEAVQAAQQDLLEALQLSVVLVFLLMGTLFESFVLPLAVLASVPCAFLGSLLLLLLLGHPLDMMGFVGGLVLVGIVVNNAIVLMDAIGRYRRTGMEREEACLAAIRSRLRPVWMTSLSTICGLLPMAFADPRSGGTSWRTLSLVVSGGLAASTFLTIVVVPLLYTLLDDLSARLGGFLRWGLAPGRAGAPEARKR